MRIAVFGGTGTLGRPLVEMLAGQGHAVRVLSRSAPSRPLPDGASHSRVDLTNGEGLAAALDGVETVVDAASSRSQAREVLVEGTARLAAAGARAGVRHHLLISIVGCDRVPMSYYRHKTAQEQALTAAAVPWSILRATQFHDLLDGTFTAAARLGLRPTGAARLQPIDVDVVAERMATAAVAPPGGALPSLAGPEARTLGELSAAWKRARNRHLLPLRLPSIGGLGRTLRAGGLCDESAATPGSTFEEWLRG
jgi:uncharacterized protein YbjT (DUF2867 family)